MDVKFAFLNGDLLEEVYVQRPPGSAVAGQEGKVLRLRKALYGLRQAPRAWNAKLDESLCALGFERCPSEHAVYRRGSRASLLIVGVYVDDLVITGAATTEIISFKQQMTGMFRMSDLGMLSYNLGIEVSQERDRIVLGQAAYAKRLLESAGMEDCNPSNTPMEARIKLSKESTAAPVDKTKYRSIIGGLRYLVHTRPDGSFAVGYLSRFMEKPASDHYAAVKHLLRYVAGTLDHGCAYERGDGGLQLTGYSDSDHAGDTDDRKSTRGVIFFLGKSPVSWQSPKQRVVALSSCEAEYMAATAAVCQGIWLSRLLGEMLNKEAARPKILVDNKSAFSLAKNPLFHDRRKHIEIRYHFIRAVHGECEAAGPPLRCCPANPLVRPGGAAGLVAPPPQQLGAPALQAAASPGAARRRPIRPPPSALQQGRSHNLPRGALCLLHSGMPAFQQPMQSADHATVSHLRAFDSMGTLQVQSLAEDFQSLPVSSEPGSSLDDVQGGSARCQLWLGWGNPLSKMQDISIHTLMQHLQMLEGNGAAIFAHCSMMEKYGFPWTQIEFLTFGSTSHFHNFKSSLSQLQMMVVADLDDVFLPLPDDLLDNINVEAALGPAHGAASMVMGQTGDKEHILRIPEDPFYRQMAAEFMKNQVYHYPSFKATTQREKLKHELTRETASESVMRIRCGKDIHHPLVKDVSGCIRQLHLRSQILVKCIVKQILVPLCQGWLESCPAANTVKASEKFEGIPEPICCTTSHRKETDIYILALCKSLALSGGYADVSLDERCAAGFSMMILPARRLLNFIYPSLYRLDEVLTVGLNPCFKMKFHLYIVQPAGIQPDRIDGSLKRLPLTLQCLDTAGLYLLDDGFTFLVWLGRMLQPELMNDILGVSLSSIPDLSKIQLRECDNNHLRDFMAVLRAPRERDSWRYQLPCVVRQGEQPREGFLLLSNLVEDQMAGTSSYMGWILQVDRQNTKLMMMHGGWT
uniref:Retrovirus-related Pol polyprotein from transposon TNT 1-94 n=1 Tax=Aegilops tauschii TaxID=37682 RepID=R7W628_AEGTA